MLDKQLLNQVVQSGFDNLIFLMRVEGHTLFYYEMVNDLAKEKTGITDKDIGKELQEVLSEEHYYNMYPEYVKAAESNEKVVYEDYFHSTSHNELISETTLMPLVNEDGECTHILASVRDITDYRHAELAKEQSKRHIQLSEQRYKSLFSDNTDAIVSVDLEGIMLEVNRAFEQLTGYHRGELLGKPATVIADEEQRKYGFAAFEMVLEKQAQSFELNTSFNGYQLDIDIKMTPIIVEEEVVGVYVILKDITEQRHAERTLMKNQERFQLIAESSHDLITLVDDHGIIQYASPSYRTILGYSEDQFIGESLLHKLHEEDGSRILNAFDHAKRKAQPIAMDFRQQHINGDWLWFELQAKPIFDENGHFYQMIVVTRNISERKAYEDELKSFAYHDPLTNLPNRRKFKQKMLDYLSEDRGEEQFAVLMFDIDDFKPINDTHGHDFGDEVIKEFGRRIESNLRDGDLVARMGGDEFIALLTGLHSEDDVIQVVRRIQDTLEGNWYIDNKVVNLTTSIGIVFPNHDQITDEDLIKMADNALYGAKALGKDTYQLMTVD
ncbi:sensor domain-containing protein [Alkalibacillus salilacus]|uniref:Diguanylate cyclase (GGDEF)-like protein/PAS domain S-box-containing protein n=1 Tax=Alkalibacillus salilacus TaxID=284582 RepID=A0ABT9VFR2_9BACI|nr:sensor domain-containing diguanylate cyclase [Alkalibacillus salilacus]MDQ0159794.1 diguanylate cyclase (GGDEF)-like protein/PAS domain S-box-containing protein [Alkalibacillus salilacus]